MNQYKSNVVKRVVMGFTSFALVLSTVTAAVPVFLTQMANATPNTSLSTTNLSDWYLEETRTSGHNELIANALHVWTEPSTGSYANEFSKAAGYHAANFDLINAGNPSIDFNSFSGVRPSLQFGVDKDGNGTWDGYLVYEPWAYGDGMWWSSKNFGVSAGMGYTSFGTLGDYTSANPSAKVISIGYSLGSGVIGDATINKITAGGVDYTFDIASPVDSLAPATPTNGQPNATFKNTNDFYFTWSDSADAGSAVKYEFQSATSNNVDAAGSLVGSWNSVTQGNSEQNNLTTPTVHSTGAGDGTYYWQVRAFDAAGNKSAWSSVWNMTIDTQKPATPQNVKVVAAGVALPNPAFTKEFNVTTSWGAVAGATSYEYKYWNSIPGNPWKEDAAYKVITSDTSIAGGFTEGQGTHFVQIRAIDAAGNLSEPTAPFIITYDKTAPDAAIAGVTSGQSVSGDVALQGVVTDQNPMNSYFVITGSNGYKQTSFYGDGRLNHDFLWKTGALSNGTYKIQFETRDKANNKDAGSTVSLMVVVDNPKPLVVGENFNTNSDAGYKGLNVGFNIADFKTVTGVSVALYGADGNLIVDNTDNQKLLDLIADGTTQLSTPFITDPGTYVEEYWNLGAHKWLATDKPTKAIVTVTGTDNTGALVTVNAELAQLVEPNGWTFASILPVVAALPATTTPTAQVAPVAPIVGAAPYATVAPAAIAATTPAGEVLGASTTKQDAPAVAGAQTTNDVAGEPTAKDGFNSAWYWLLTIPVAGAAWWALAAFRHRES